jgi:predicted nucleic acid-binding protein
VQIAVLDACVLYPAPLRDLLLQLALGDLYRAKWTERIHDEWMGNVLANRPDLSRQKIERTRALMDLHTRDCLVKGYESLIPTLKLPDQDDRHVLAAAIRSEADRIVTFNLKDFPSGNLKPLGVEAIHPDEFLLSLMDEDSTGVLAAVCRQRASLKNPSKTLPELLAVFHAQGLKKFTEQLARTML